MIIDKISIFPFLFRDQAYCEIDSLPQRKSPFQRKGRFYKTSHRVPKRSIAFLGVLEVHIPFFSILNVKRRLILESCGTFNDSILFFETASHVELTESNAIGLERTNPFTRFSMICMTFS
jgi:hypothetical protein